MKATGSIRYVLVLFCALALAPAAVLAKSSDDNLPEKTANGLVLKEHTKNRVVYAAPGATLDPYTKIWLVDCYVAFEKNWERDYNMDTVGLEQRVNADDMQRIETDLAAEFKKVFTKELEDAGYQLVEQAADDVLIVRPAIINLNVTAPDLERSFATNVVQSAGSMTLYMELYDSATNAQIAEVYDAEADNEGFAQQANRVTNKAAADRIIKKWAEALRSHLGAVQASTTKPKDK
jgi:hypothetical protein